MTSTEDQGASGAEDLQLDPGMWDLRLYVAGQTEKSVAAIENLQGK